jgi:hypothetical protein
LSDSLFDGCKLLPKAVLSRSIIRDRLFGGCISLKSVSLTVPVSRIGDRSFFGCWALRNIDLSTPSPHAEIEEMAFAGSGLLEVTFPAKLRSIGDSAFCNCKSLESVRLPRELERLGTGVLGECTSLKQLHYGDVGEWKDPAGFFSGGKLSRLELTVELFAFLPREAINNWMAGDGSIVSSAFSGQRLGRFVIQSKGWFG